MCQFIREQKMSNNLGQLRLYIKGLALEALSVKVWVNNDNITIGGGIAISAGSFTSTSSIRCDVAIEVSYEGNRSENGRLDFLL